MTSKTILLLLLASTMIALPAASAIAFMPGDQVCVVSVQLPARFACARATITVAGMTCSADSCTVTFQGRLAVDGPGCGDLSFPRLATCAPPASVRIAADTDPETYMRATQTKVYSVVSRLCISLEETRTIETCKDIETLTPPIPARESSML